MGTTSGGTQPSASHRKSEDAVGSSYQCGQGTPLIGSGGFHAKQP
jgi:hypothetical protein